MRRPQLTIAAPGTFGDLALSSVPAGSYHLQGVDTPVLSAGDEDVLSRDVCYLNTRFQMHALYVEQGEIFAV